MAEHSLDDMDRRLADLRAMLESVPNPIVLVGSNGLVREANAASFALLSALRIGQPLSYGLRAPAILDAIAATPPGRSAEVEYQQRVPTERSFQVQITVLADSDVMLFFRDLSAARRLDRMRVDFVANVSHELRTPLASLVGFIETLQGPAREDQVARDRFLKIMREQASRMSRLIDDLLSLSRVELREHVAPSVPIDLRAVADHIIDTLKPMAQERKVEIAFAGCEEPAVVLGDKDELSRVVENVVENAVKYGESGGRVEVTITRGATDVELSVRDYGPGIAHEHLPRLTERFYRVDVAQSREKGGTGLGLALVKHILNRHRGRMSIESTLGAGATFTVRLPLATEPDSRR